MIQTIGVIGAGVMGAGIAAQAANAGLHVVLLDIVPGAASRAVQTLLKSEPAAFMHKRNARLVTTGDLKPDIDKLSLCDWIVEAIVERVEAKQALYRELEAIRKPGSIVSSNTSTIRLADLLAGLPERFSHDFLITHFFNPPRYMRLLELVVGPATRADARAMIAECADRVLGKTVIECRDTPGFIANRIGTLWLTAAVRHAIDLGLTVEEADAVVGRPMGVPKTGVFGLLDLVGLDLMPHVSGSLLASLPAGDAFHAIYREESLLLRLIAEGRTGRKGKGGFYTLQQDGEKRQKLAVDFATGEYRPTEKPRLDSVEAAGRDLRALAEHHDRGGRYARQVLLDTLSYAAALVPEIAERISDVDAAMRLGYNWKHGPFELIDRVGAAWLADALRAEGRVVPKLLEAVGDGGFYRTQNGRAQEFCVDIESGGTWQDIPIAPGVLLLADSKRAGAPMMRNSGASLWDIGDGVACLEFHTKMNALDPDVLAMVGKAVAAGKKGQFQALVIYNDGDNFSVGANLGLALFAANIAAWGEIESMIESGQKAYRALRAAPFPVVGAASGMALGGGCEILLHCDAIQAHAETYMGLVEVGVGVVPAWGGCATMLARWANDPTLPKGPMPPLVKAFEQISTARVAKSAAEARDENFLRRTDRITMNRDRLLADAKARALELVADYQPPAPAMLRLAGATGRAALKLAVNGFVLQGKATPHDIVVCERLADTLTGGEADYITDTSEDAILKLERSAFMALLRHAATLARIEHMLETGKPLRN